MKNYLFLSWPALLGCLVTSLSLYIQFVNSTDICSNPEYWSGRQNVTIAVGDVKRLFELYTPWQSRTGPPEYITGPPLTSRGRGLVINWHGCSPHAPILDYHAEISKITEEAMNRGFYVITPLGTKISGNFGWNADGIECGSHGVDDFEFFEALLNFTDAHLCVDDKLIYSVGFSTGAFLSYGIACRYPEKVAGVAADAGGLSRSYYETCRLADGAVPIQAFHSLDDPTVPYNGTSIWVGQDEMDALWRERNGCDGSEPTIITYESETTLCQYWDCPLAPVESCALKGIDHCWYGGRSGGFPVCHPRPGDVDATKHIFDFWAKNRLSRMSA